MTEERLFEILRSLWKDDKGQNGEFEVGFNAALSKVRVLVEKEAEESKIPDKVKIKGWVARDKDGQISCYCDKPYRSHYCWYSFPRYEVWILPDELYPDLKWEDEPIEVELYLSKKN